MAKPGSTVSGVVWSCWGKGDPQRRRAILDTLSIYCGDGIADLLQEWKPAR